MSNQEQAEQYKRLLSEAEKLHFNLWQRLLYSDRPLEQGRLELELADNLRQIKHIKQLLQDLEQEPDKEIPRQPIKGNPFNRVGIVSAELFIGRSSKLRSIKDGIDEGNSYIVVGSSKIGKSSFMHRLHQSYLNEGWQTIFFDFGEPEPIEYHYEVLTKKLGGVGKSYQDVKAAIVGKPVILFIDEFQLGPARGFDADQIGGFKVLSRRDDTKFRVVAASTRPAREVYPVTNPNALPDSLPYAFLINEPLSLLNETDCQRLLQHYLAQQPTQFSSEHITELIRLGERHPFKLMRAACRLYESLSDPDYDEDWREAFKLDIETMM